MTAFTSGVSKKGQNVSMNGQNKSYFENARNIQRQFGNRNQPMSHYIVILVSPSSSSQIHRRLWESHSHKSPLEVRKPNFKTISSPRERTVTTVLAKDEQILTDWTHRDQIDGKETGLCSRVMIHTDRRQGLQTVMCKLWSSARVSRAWLIRSAPPPAAAGVALMLLSLFPFLHKL